MSVEEPVVATSVHPEISAPLLLKETLPATEVVAVIVSIAPYIGAAEAIERLMTGDAREMIKFEVATVSN